MIKLRLSYAFSVCLG